MGNGDSGKALTALTLFLGKNNNSMTNFYVWKDIIESVHLSDVGATLTEDENSLLKILCCAIDIEILNKKLGIFIMNINKYQDDESHVINYMSTFVVG